MPGSVITSYSIHYTKLYEISDEEACPECHDQQEEHNGIHPNDNSSSPFATANPFESLHIPDEDDEEVNPDALFNHVETSSASSPTAPVEATADNPGLQQLNQDNPTPCVPGVLDRLINAARDADTAPTPSSGARLRSRQVLRLFVGRNNFV